MTKKSTGSVRRRSNTSRTLEEKLNIFSKVRDAIKSQHLSVPQAVKKHGISVNTYYDWKKSLPKLAGKQARGLSGAVPTASDLGTLLPNFASAKGRSGKTGGGYNPVVVVLFDPAHLSSAFDRFLSAVISND